MTVTIKQHEVGTVAVFAVSGRLTLEGSAGAVEQAVVREVDRGRKQIVIDVQDVSYVDSAGLGELVASYARALTAGASVKVQNANPRLVQLLRITNLRDLLLA
jgi:anti-sigma B factor antagonist